SPGRWIFRGPPPNSPTTEPTRASKNPARARQGLKGGRARDAEGGAIRHCPFGWYRRCAAMTPVVVGDHGGVERLSFRGYCMSGTARLSLLDGFALTVAGRELV